MERAIMCPQCNAPLTPSPFARSVVCSYCGTTVQLDTTPIVSAAQFHDAFRVWNSPATYQIPSWLSIGKNHWMLNERIATGDISDVFTGQRARWPTELVILKLLRDRKNFHTFDNEWDILQELHRSEAAGSDNFTTLIPQPVIRGEISNGSYMGRRVNIYRWKSAFYYTFEDVLRTYPQGIPPRASIWIWRRILEILTFIHSSGIVHGAILPSHLLAQENEHGILLVGYGSAGRPDDKLRVNSDWIESLLKSSKRSSLTLNPQLDLIMSARCIVYILGGNPETGSLPSTVPKHLSNIIQQIALGDPSDSGKKDAWSIREELGSIANDVFGAPQFIPIVMPK